MQQINSLLVYKKYVHQLRYKILQKVKYLIKAFTKSDEKIYKYGTTGLHESGLYLPQYVYRVIKELITSPNT